MKRCDRCGANVVDVVGSRQACLFDVAPADPRATDAARAELRAGRVLCSACQRTDEMFPTVAPVVVTAPAHHFPQPVIDHWTRKVDVAERAQAVADLAADTVCDAPAVNYSALSPLDLLAHVAREGTDGPAARVAAARMIPPAPPPSLRCSAEVYEQSRKDFADAEEERFVVVALDGRNRPMERIVVSQGTASTCVVHPRDLFRRLLLTRRPTVAAILVHNHPSGDPAPSEEDGRLTERIAEAGKLIGVPILDHIIIGSEGYYSFRDSGRL